MGRESHHELLQETPNSLFTDYTILPEYLRMLNKGPQMDRNVFL